MTPRVLWAHIAFAVLALGFAWQRAHADKERGVGPSSAVLLDAKAGDVASVAYTWPKGSTQVTPQGRGAARIAVVDLDRTLDDKKPDAKDSKGDAGTGADAAEDPPPALAAAAEREKARFPGGKTVLSSVEALEPLKTRRTLGEVDAGRLKAMGLDPPQRSLTVTTAGGTSLVLDVGEQAYGGQGRYARVRGQRQVHLLEPAVVAGLEGTLDSLLEKRIVTADVADVVGFKASSGDKERAFVHADRAQPQKRRFVPREDPASTDDGPGKVMTSLRNLRGTKLVAEPDLAGGSAVAAIQVELDGREPVAVELIERGQAGYVAKAGPWAWQVSETQARELLEDIQGALD